MAKIVARDANISINTVALEDDIDQFTMRVTQELPVVTAFADAGPRRLTANYDHGLDISGGADFASGQSDATLFDLIGNAGVATAVDPTGASAAANDPNYDCASQVLSSYQISGGVGGRIDFSAALEGNAALTRAVA